MSYSGNLKRLFIWRQSNTQLKYILKKNMISVTYCYCCGGKWRTDIQQLLYHCSMLNITIIIHSWITIPDLYDLWSEIVVSPDIFWMMWIIWEEILVVLNFFGSVNSSQNLEEEIASLIKTVVKWSVIDDFNFFQEVFTQLFLLLTQRTSPSKGKSWVLSLLLLSTYLNVLNNFMMYLHITVSLGICIASSWWY